MQKILLILLLLGGSFFPTYSSSVPEFNGVPGENERMADDEYDRYRKRADTFFAKGDYPNALRQYRNCLEVPTYENDSYAKGRIALVEKLIQLRQDAYQALNAGKGEEAVALFEKIVADNPEDSTTKVNLTDYWTGEATKSYAQQNYEIAKIQYQEALKYATKPALIQIQIQNSEAYLKQKSDQLAKVGEAEKNAEVRPDNVLSTMPAEAPKEIKQPEVTIPKRYMGIKLAAAVVGLGAGAYAYSLHNRYQDKLDEVNRLGKMADPDGDDLILTPGDFNPWQSAYKDATEAKQDRSKFVAALGVVGVAAIAEVVLLVLPRLRKSTGLSVQASPQNVGLGVRYTFR